MTTTTIPKWTLYTGDDRVLVFAVKDEAGEPVDCATATAIDFVIRYEDANGVLTDIAKALGNGIDIEPDTGNPRVTLAGGDSKGIKSQVAEYELDVTLQGKRFTAVRGEVSIVRSLAEPA